MKDKWKEIGGVNWESRKKEFDLVSTLKMMKYINESIVLSKAMEDTNDNNGDSEDLELNEEIKLKGKNNKKKSNNEESSDMENGKNCKFFFKNF